MSVYPQWVVAGYYCSLSVSSTCSCMYVWDSRYYLKVNSTCDVGDVEHVYMCLRVFSIERNIH